MSMKIGTWAGVTAATFLGIIAADENKDSILPLAGVQAVTTADVVTPRLERVIANSEKIFSGVCTKIEKRKKDPENPSIEFTFKVTEGIKGVKGREIKVNFPDNPNNPQLNIYEEQKYILFLKTPIDSITPPLGLFGQPERFDVYKKAAEMGEFVVLERKEFRYEEFMKIVKDILTKQNNKK